MHGRFLSTVAIAKVKAHLLPEHVAVGRMTHRDWAGNGRADQLATRAAKSQMWWAPDLIAIWAKRKERLARL
eukprot:977866-Alexandrium_andersonii.AAC.1